MLCLYINLLYLQFNCSVLHTMSTAVVIWYKPAVFKFSSRNPWRWHRLAETCSSNERLYFLSLLPTCATYRCDDTRCCIIQFWPPDDEHMVLEVCRGMK